MRAGTSAESHSCLLSPGAAGPWRLSTVRPLPGCRVAGRVVGGTCLEGNVQTSRRPERRWDGSCLSAAGLHGWAFLA